MPINKNDVEFYNTEFPKCFNDFIYLSREIKDGEIDLCDKEGLILLCKELKRQELKYYNLYHELLNQVEA